MKRQSRNSFFQRCSLFTVMAALGLFLFAATGSALDVTVVGPDGNPVPTGFRWLLEEDVNYHPDPNADPPPPEPDPNAVATNFHKSYMPIAAQGSSGSAIGSVAIPDPTKHYFLSVLPDDGYTLSGGAIAPGQTTLRVTVNPLPLPTAQITFFVFHDNAPINNAPDLPQEVGLGGFQIILEEPAGRYGAAGGQVLQDAYGNPIGTTYQFYIDENGDRQPVFDVNGDPIVDQIGAGAVTTNANGVAVIKNLSPGKYGVIIDPPEGQGWIQTSTIEGSPVIDAWVKANEPPYFTEFGPAGHHVEFGFVQLHNNIPAGGTATITGQVVNTHNSRPPDYTFWRGAPFPDVYVGLNDMSVGRGLGIFAAEADANSNFTIPNVPDGNYQIAIWDQNLDIIFASQGVVIQNGQCLQADGVAYGSCDLGQVGVFDWFAHLRGTVFSDTVIENGFPDPGEDGIPDQAVLMRWRDGTVYNATATNVGGDYAFDEVFPFFNWLVAEVDFARYKATGATIVVDGGGQVEPSDLGGLIDPNTMSPQVQDQVNPNTGNALSRTETGEVLTQAFQGYLGQTSYIHWGKTPYGPGPDGEFGTADDENGGISGIVFYDTTRAEDNPVDNLGEEWQPGIPNIQVNLYADGDIDSPPQGNFPGLEDVDRNANGVFDAADGIVDDLDNSGTVTLADIDNAPLGWADGGAMGPEDVDRNGNDIFDAGDAIQVTWTDSWDDSLPNDCPGDPTDIFYDMDGDGRGDCYDGLRNYNQVRPGVFDGGYAFGSRFDPYMDAPGAVEVEGLLSGIYIVEVGVKPDLTDPGAHPIYQVVSSLDKNVDFGETYQPSPLAFPPPCVGEATTLPLDATLNLFPGVPANLAGETFNECGMKQVLVQSAKNAPAEFFLFTEVPPAAHVKGMILNDLANEFDPNNPVFGEKFAPSYVPISFKDFNGREITRAYSDQYGQFNMLVPSTFTTNIPSPSGMSPNMLISCMNDPGPIEDPNNPGQFITDPEFKPQYTTFCYTFQYMPATITYLDTPVEPIAAFAGENQETLDCEFPDGTPIVRQVMGAGYNGPYVSGTGQTLTIIAMGDTEVPQPGAPGSMEVRDYGFGPYVDGVSSVTVGGTELTNVAWSNGSITATVPAGATTGQLVVTRADNGLSTVGAATVTVGQPGDTYSVLTVSPAGGWPATPIQDAIDTAQPGDLILVGPGTYDELVILPKELRLQGAGAPSTVIQAFKAPGEKVQVWRDDVTFLIENGDVTLLPGQTADFDIVNNEPGFLNNAEGAGVTVLGQATGDPLQSTWTGGGEARIDGFTIMGSDIGGGIVVNGFVKGLEIANNRIINNAGLFGGGITAGVESAGGDIVDADNDNLNIHNNHITQNGGRSGGAGGVSLFTGTDAYQVTDNYICGNFTLGSGAGIGHFGYNPDGLIAGNDILFNQSFNQMVATGSAGGGIAVEGFKPVGGLGDGSGNVTIDGNRIQGNMAGVGDGGGIRIAFADGVNADTAPYSIDIINNLIVNNASGLAGGGISVQDSLDVNIVHNTVANNDSTATAAEAFAGDPNTSTPQPAGIVSRAHSTDLAGLVGPGHSNPSIVNSIIRHNRSFYWSATANGGVGGLLPDPSSPVFNDLAVLGRVAMLNPQSSVLTDASAYPTNYDFDPLFNQPYFNGSSTLTAIPEDTTPLDVAAAVDEGGNFIDARFGPLQPVGDYHLLAVSPAVNAGQDVASLASYPVGLDFDYDAEARDRAEPDVGADEVVAAGPVDAVAIPTVVYDLAQQTLTVVATSDQQPDVTLTVTAYINGNPTNLGTLEWKSWLSFYRNTFNNVPVRPSSVVVRSSGGGAAAYNFPAADTVTINNVVYDAVAQTLTVVAESSEQPNVTLSALGYGALDWKNWKGFYRSTFSGVATRPAAVTVASSSGGSAVYTFPAPDTVTIEGIFYDAGAQTLTVVATSTDQPDVMLSAEGFGALGWKSWLNFYRNTFTGVASQPASVTVNSSGGGSATQAVP